MFQANFPKSLNVLICMCVCIHMSTHAVVYITMLVLCRTIYVIDTADLTFIWVVYVLFIRTYLAWVALLKPSKSHLPQDYPSWGLTKFTFICLTSSDIIRLGFHVTGSYPKWGQQGLTVYPSQVTVIDVSKAGGACYIYTFAMATKSCCLALSVAAGTRAAGWKEQGEDGLPGEWEDSGNWENCNHDWLQDMEKNHYDGIVNS